MKKLLLLVVVFAALACENAQPRDTTPEGVADSDIIDVELSDDGIVTDDIITDDLIDAEPVDDALVTDDIITDDLIDAEPVDDALVTDDLIDVSDDIDTDVANDMDTEPDILIDNITDTEDVDNVDNEPEIEAEPEVDVIDEDLVDVDIAVDNAPDIDNDIPAPAGMVEIPAGSFWRGCDYSHFAMCYERSFPYAEVYISKFFIDIDEVTVAQFKACWDSGECKPDGAVWRWGAATPQPLSNTDWNDATNYCTWVGKRLPTEAEWEKAARGTDGRVYPWGNAAPAGQMDLSPYGVKNAWGSVREWVNDWYAINYYHDARALTDPQGPQTGDFGYPNVYKVIRGPQTDQEIYNRGYGSNDTSDTGFRCAKTIY